MKIIAVCFMVVDHFGQIVLKNGIILHATRAMISDRVFSRLMSAVDICHILGRISFPIFCFLLVEGFLYTHSRRDYFRNLGLFAILSEPIYDLACSGKVFSLAQQNVLYTLLLGLAVIAVIEKYDRNIMVIVCVILAGAMLAYLGAFDGGYYGIALISVFYLLYDKPGWKYLCSVLVMYLAGLDFTLGGLIDPYFLTAVCSLILISGYNGRRGMKMKYFFYLFYPGHLLILWMISVFLWKYLLAFVSWVC